MTLMRAEIDTFNAADLMTPNVLWVHQDMAVSELADFLAENEISGVPVLDENDEPVGVVSATDIAGTGRPEGTSRRRPVGSQLLGTILPGQVRHRGHPRHARSKGTAARCATS